MSGPKRHDLLIDLMQLLRPLEKRDLERLVDALSSGELFRVLDLVDEDEEDDGFSDPHFAGDGCCTSSDQAVAAEAAQKSPTRFGANQPWTASWDYKAPPERFTILGGEVKVDSFVSDLPPHRPLGWAKLDNRGYAVTIPEHQEHIAAMVEAMTTLYGNECLELVQLAKQPWPRPSQLKASWDASVQLSEGLLKLYGIKELDVANPPTTEALLRLTEQRKQLAAQAVKIADLEGRVQALKMLRPLSGTITPADQSHLRKTIDELYPGRLSADDDTVYDAAVLLRDEKHKADRYGAILRNLSDVAHNPNFSSEQFRAIVDQAEVALGRARTFERTATGGWKRAEPWEEDDDQ
jgi:hypothetical protein